MLTLKQHKRKWNSCTLCPLGAKATHHVLYRGDIPATFLFIGESPGPVEDQVGEPFLGPAGKVFKQLLLDVGLDSDYCVTNILACFPFKPDDPTTFRAPKKEEATICCDRVRELVLLVKPKVVILLGDVAKKYWNKSIERIESFSFLQKRLELRHPSFILRNGGIGSVEFKRNLLKLREVVDATKKKTAS